MRVGRFTNCPRRKWAAQSPPQPPPPRQTARRRPPAAKRRLVLLLAVDGGGDVGGLGRAGMGDGGADAAGGNPPSAGWPLTVAGVLAVLNVSYLDIARRAAKGPARHPAAAKSLAANHPRPGDAHRGDPLRGQPGDVRAVHVPVSHRPGMHLFRLRAKPSGDALRDGDVSRLHSPGAVGDRGAAVAAGRRDRPTAAAWAAFWPGISARWCSFPARYGILHLGWPAPCGGGTKNWPRSIAAWSPPPRSGRGT